MFTVVFFTWITSRWCNSITDIFQFDGILNLAT